MSYREYIAWIKYANKNGSLNTGQRIERTIALSATQFANVFMKKANGQKFDINDFSIYSTTEEREVTPESAMQLLTALAKQE